MDYKQLERLSRLSGEELTVRLIELFGQILKCHDAGRGLNAFYWQDVTVGKDGVLSLSDVVDTALTEEVRYRNYQDYAAIVYCISTRQKYAEFMPQDAGRKIEQPVLREIVLTLCGRNYSIEPLIAKLQEPYINEDAFFNDYSTVDEKDATEAYEKEKAEREERQREFENTGKSHAAYVQPIPQKPWYDGFWKYVLLALCFGIYKAYKANEKQEQKAATEQMHRRMEERKQDRDLIRRLSREKLKLKPIKQDSTTSHRTRKLRFSPTSESSGQNIVNSKD